MSSGVGLAMSVGVGVSVGIVVSSGVGVGVSSCAKTVRGAARELNRRANVAMAAIVFCQIFIFFSGRSNYTQRYRTVKS